MNLRAIFSAIVLGAIVAFIALNQKNACDISFGFTVMAGVPVYLTVLSSVVLGMILVLPLSLGRRRKAVGKDRGVKKNAEEPGLLSQAAALRQADEADARTRR